MDGKGFPDHIDIVYEGEFFVYQMQETEATLRCCSMEKVAEQRQQGIRPIDYTGLWQVSYANFNVPQEEVYFERNGLLHIMDVFYEDGSQERVTMASLRPEPPLDLGASDEAQAWAAKIRAKARKYDMPLDR